MADDRPADVSVGGFLDGAFLAELEEIGRRRSNSGQPELPRVKARPAPTTSLGLVGLAFSGGGIRSASFCLGVVQRLIDRRLLSRVDYLSTVSGGGYIGSCLSSLMRGSPGGERALVDRDGVREPPAVNYIRNGSNYLVPSGFLNTLRLPAVIFFGAVQTLLLMLPVVVAAVLATEAFFEATSRFLPFANAWVPAIGLTPLVAALFARPLFGALGSSSRSWEARDKAGRRLAGFLVLAVCSLMAVPALAGLGYLVNSGPATVFAALRSTLVAGMASAADGRGWVLWGGLGLVIVAGLAAHRWKTRLVLPLVGVAGPLLLVGLYLLACLYVINSPMVLPSDNAAFSRSVAAYVESRKATGDSAAANDAALAAVRAAVTPLLKAKRVRADGGLYDLAVVAGPTEVDTRVVLRRRQADPWWWRLTTYRPETLTLRFQDCGDAGRLQCVIIDELSLFRGHTEWWLYLAGFALFLFNATFVNVNRISLHAFYRDRLSRTFLVTRPAGEAEFRAGPLEPNPDLRLSELGGSRSTAPYHLINAALNLQGSRDLQLRDRKTVSFLLSQRHCGSEKTGYCSSAFLEACDPDFTLASAMAVSAAAAAPNMGTTKTGPLSFVMAMLNLRLSYWLLNPSRVTLWAGPAATLGIRPGLAYLWREATGSVSESRTLINCSDGGHFENLAVYELIRRRCRAIVCVDAEADPGFAFHGFNTLQRYVEIDFGARITVDLGSIVPDGSGTSARQYAVGEIAYPDGERGTFVYLKLSYGGSEPQYVRFYRAEHPEFPHEPTSDQFFDETQFEVYRALGSHVADLALADPEVARLFVDTAAQSGDAA